jgi:hypothetical protein
MIHLSCATLRDTARHCATLRDTARHCATLRFLTFVLVMINSFTNLESQTLNPNFTVTSTVDKCGAQEITFKAIQTGNNTHKWTFGDGTPQVQTTQQSFTHIFYPSSTTQVFQVNHIIGNSSSSTAQATLPITVNIGMFDFIIGQPNTITNSNTIVGFSGMLSSKKILIRGKLVLNASVSWAMSDVSMDSKSEVNVPSGITLSIVRETVVHGCERKWKQIELNSGGKIVTEKATIKDAEFGIKLANSTSISCQYTQFLNNTVGIYLPANQLGLSGQLSNTITQIGAFIGNTFKFDVPTVLIDYQNQNTYNAVINQSQYSGIFFSEGGIGMLLFDANYFAIGALSSNSPIISIYDPTKLNRFQGTEVGIHSEYCNLQIINTTFSDALFGMYLGSQDGLHFVNQIGTGSGNPIEPTFKNCGTLIQGGGIDGKFIENNALQFGGGMIFSMFKNRDLYIAGNHFNGTGGYTSYNFNYPNYPFDGTSILFGIFEPPPILGQNTTKVLVNRTEYTGDQLHFQVWPPNTSNPQGSLIGSGVMGAVQLDNTIQSNTYFFKNSIDTKSGGPSFGLTNTNGVILQENTVNFSNPKANDAGIFVTNSPNTNLLENHLTGTGTLGDEPQHNSGIYTLQSPNFFYHCNDVKDLNNGIVFSSSSNSPGSFATTQFKKGSFTNGLYYLPDGSITGTQTHTGNIWEDGITVMGQEALNESFILPNRFYVDKLENLNFYPDPITPSNDTWFKDLFDSNLTPTCGTTIGKTEKKPIESDMIIAHKQVTSKKYQEATEWLSAIYLYEKLNNDPELLESDPQFKVFYDSLQGTPIAQLTEIRKKVGAISSVASIELWTSFADATEKQKAMIEEIRILDSIIATYSLETLYANPDVEQPFDLFLKQRNLKSEEIIGIQLILHGLLLQINESIKIGVENIIAQNNEIVPQNILESNEQTARSVYLNSVLQGKKTLTQQQIDLLLPIANQCIYTGGSSVSSARAMLSSLTNVSYTFENNCTEELLPKMVEDRYEKYGWSISPSPANNFLVINAPKKHESENVNLIDMYGRNISQSFMTQDELTHTISTNLLPSGVYWLKISDHIDFYIHKVIISH